MRCLILLPFLSLTMAAKNDPMCPNTDPKNHTETFQGSSHADAPGIPQDRPFTYEAQRIDFYNLAQLKFDSIVGTGLMDFMPGSQSENKVAAVGGVINHKGVAMNRSIAYMVVKPKSLVNYFDLNGFDFFCVKDQKPFNCTIGVKMSKGFSFGDDSDPPLFRFTTSELPAKMAHVTIGDAGKLLRFASIGRPIAVDAEPNKYSDADRLDPDHNAGKVTVYIDNLDWTSHACTPKTDPRPFGGAMARILEYP